MRWVFYTAGDVRMASSRLRAFLPGKALAEAGHIVLWNPPPDQIRADVVVVQKRPDLTSQYAGWRAKGTTVVYDCDDLYEWARAAAVGADLVTVDTPMKLAFFHNARVVPDALDVPPVYAVKSEHREKLEEAVWFGHPENLIHIDHAAEACRRCGVNLSVITDLKHPAFQGMDAQVTGYGWSGESIDRELIQYDLAILPYRFDTTWGAEWVRAKSANRVYKAWALGLPVAATPIPSYMEAGVIYAATTVEEWMAALSLLQDRHMRLADAVSGQRRALQFAPARVAALWELAVR